MKQFWILDEREIWHQGACDAAKKHGYVSHRLYSGDIDVERFNPGDVGFIRPHADWRRLPANRDRDDPLMRSRLTMIQDRAQVEVYEDKRQQTRRWGRWMPETVVYHEEEYAQAFVAAERTQYPLVSKAAVGASSVNVRILYDRKAAREHVRSLFHEGLLVHHGAHCPQTRQKGYVILQRFIPHTVTYRVNAIGDARAVFFRYCYPDKPVAQTGNVAPAECMTDEVASLLEYADMVFADIGSKWCALDILKDTDGTWKLLETSLAWPWPSPGRCDEHGEIFRSGGKKWKDMFTVMFDQLEAGAWAGVH